MTCCSVAVQDYDLYFRAEQLIHLYKEHNGNRTDQTKKKTKEMQLRKMKKSQIILGWFAIVGDIMAAFGNKTYQHSFLIAKKEI